ncbi:MAG: FAD-dependent oxidoreductase [Acidobacteriota bacterium]
MVGAGHAHLEVLRRCAEERKKKDGAAFDLTVIAPMPRQVYSGMVPGFLAGTYTLDEISLEVAPLVARTEGELIEGSAEALDPKRQVVRLADGREVGYDLVSFAVGSNTAGIDRPEIAEGAVPVKPLDRVIDLQTRLESLVRDRPEKERGAAVVGGGAAGYEVALAIRTALGAEAQVHLIERGPRLLVEYPERFRKKALAVLAERGMEAQTGATVDRVEADRVILANGREIPSDLTIWLGGAIGWPLFRDSGLPLDERGFLLLDDSLRSLGDLKIFAAGDCGTLVNFPRTPKAGVYAVRQAPVLWQSLRATLSGEEPPLYLPQTGFLSILNLGDGRALMHWKGLVLEGAPIFKLKDWIDRRFLARHR